MLKTKVISNNLKVAIIFVLISLAFNVKAQNELGEVWQCQTVLSATKKEFTLSTKTDVQITPKIVNTFFHILRKDDGTEGLNQTQIDDWISLLIEDYLEHQIYIKIIGQSDLNNSIYYNGMTDANYVNLISTNTHDEAIDIYLLSPNDNYSRASGIPGIALAVGGNYEGTSVLSHEFGHCLGLYHTHSGSGCNDYLNCSENIDGSNCDICGDLV